MKTYSITTIRKKIKEYCLLINAPKKLRSIRNTPSTFGDPHVEIDERGYHYVIWERGTEFERRSTKELDELLYWLMKDITFEMASEYELNHRVPNQDSRRLLFKTQLDLLKKINTNFHERLEEEIEKILINAPYDDTE